MTTPGSHPVPSTSPYGAPPATTQRDDSTDAAVWAVRIAAGVIALGGVPMMLAGFVLVASDLEQRGEMFDGLGAMIGLAVCAIAAIFLGVAALAACWVRRRPLAAAVVVCAFGLLVTAVGFFLVGPSGLLVAAPTLLGGLVVAGLGFGGAVAARQ
ncbi:MAG TPA: hypothetical protein VFJ28_09995 [Marmoricola sp.]|nr:hypothetical protein [Marmoricola sp.]